MPEERAGLGELVKGFPAMEHCFAYGSGVYAQPGLYAHQGSSKPLVDFMFVVRDPLEWHRRNLAVHRGHYSFLGWLGPSAVVRNAAWLGVGVHFNTGVQLAEQQAIKYGVVGEAALLRDLTTWDTLYVAGRLHKPVAHLQHSPAVGAALEANLEAALTAAQLLLPERFPLQALLQRLVELSYAGDVRMGLAEDAHKARRIVEGSQQGLRALYLPRLQARGGVAKMSTAADEWAQDKDPRQLEALLASLPQALLQRMARTLALPAAPGPQGAPRWPRAVAQAAVASGRPQVLLAGSLAATVRASSARQALAGLLMAGASRSAAYVWTKARKAWASRG